MLWLLNLGLAGSEQVEVEPVVSETGQPTTFADLYTDLQNRVRVTTGQTATTIQAKRYINVALHDMSLGFEYKMPWLERSGQLRTHEAYSTGTVSINRGSAALTGTGTAWNTANTFNENNARTTGKWLLSGGAEIYPTSTVASDTSVTLSTAYVGTENLTDASYVYFEDEYALASDFLRPLDFQFFSQAYEIELIPRDDFRRRFPRPNIAGKPEFACIIDAPPSGSTAPVRRVQFSPYPTTAMLIPYSYITNAVGVTSAGVQLTNLSNDTDEPLMPLRYRHAIIYHALYHWYRDKRDDARSQEAKAEYTDIMLRIVDGQDFGSSSKGQIRPNPSGYARSARRPYGRGWGGRRYDINGRFDQGR
jgi:hypothetical protein